MPRGIPKPYIEPQPNKYLDDLGIKMENYGTNFITDEEDIRFNRWKRQRKLYGFDDRETWNLDRTFVEWLYSRCKMYSEVCIVDLTYHKYKIDGKIYTQKEIIEEILQACSAYLIAAYETEDLAIVDNMSDVQRIVRLWAEILPDMWW